LSNLASDTEPTDSSDIEPTDSDKKGLYRIYCMQGEFILKAESECYQTFEDSVFVNTGENTLNISMVPVKANTNGDNVIDLKDAIMALKITSGTAEPSVLICKPSDVNEDGRIGLEEVLYILKMIAK
jgi:hypothetical protein